MVCTGDYVTTNTQNMKESCIKFSGKQTVSRRGAPKSLCVETASSSNDGSYR
jgi:hypothetical protein